MKRPKSRKCKALLELLGGDPMEPPASFSEACDMAGVVQEPRKVNLCPTTGKHSYPSEGSARAAITSRLQKGANVRRLRAFKCEHCAQWHMTSSF